jgi:endoribonuclease Dicer
VLPSAGYGSCLPIYETDPPEFPDEWHLYPSNGQLYPSGPYGATVYLPRHLPQELRVFTTGRVHLRKVHAKMVVAFLAYKALYEFTEEQFLNKHLLPFSTIDPDEQALFDSGIGKKSGMSSVTKQMDPWARETESSDWWAYKLSIDRLPDLLMFVQRKSPDLRIEDLPTLYIPCRGAVTVSVSSVGRVHELGLSIDQAREFTRRLFWKTPGSRSSIEWNQLNFSYLFYSGPNPADAAWDTRWLWTFEARSAPDRLRLTAEAFGKAFDHPTDITYVRASGRKREDFRFVSWQFDKVTLQEEEMIQERYSRRGQRDLEVTYPLLRVKPLGRKDFLVPFPDDNSLKRHDTYENEIEYLVASHSTVHVASPDNSQYARLLPSILRHLSVTYTVYSFRDTILASTPLATLPHNALLTALSAPAAQTPSNYERMESLGDTVLKLMTSIQVMADHPYWHEGYLSLRKDHVVANVTLAKCAESKELYLWIIRDTFVPTRWLPQFEAEIPMETCEDGVAAPEQKEALSTKLLADVVEALIGASYLHGSFEMGLECIKLFGMGLRWNSLPRSVETILEKMEALDNLPLQMVEHVEKMLDYEFTKKTLVVEALTHPSYNMHVRTRPYDRLEFLGDAVLDMIVTDYLYHAPGKNYSPGHLHLRKISIVNLHFLAFICLNCSLMLDASMPKRNDQGDILVETEDNKIYLWQCLLQSNSVIMEDMSLTFARYKKVAARIQSDLTEALIYPWATLTSLQAPKFFSDIIESLLGAIFLDSRGDLAVVRKTLQVLGVMPVLERIVNSAVDVMHPVSRLAQWASKLKPQKVIKYKTEVTQGKISCKILMKDKEEEGDMMEQDEDEDMDRDLSMSELVEVEVPYRGQASRGEVRFAAAEEAIRVLRLREEESAMSF